MQIIFLSIKPFDTMYKLTFRYIRIDRCKDKGDTVISIQS